MKCVLNSSSFFFLGKKEENEKSSIECSNLVPNTMFQVYFRAKKRHPNKRMAQILFQSCCVKKGQLVLGLASGLEAFSREPPCDSIGALAARQTPETSGMAWEFLSYYPKLPSRCLRDPLSYLVFFVFKLFSFSVSRKMVEHFPKSFKKKLPGPPHQVRRP